MATQVEALFQRIDALQIDVTKDVDEKFIRGSGAGGQKINKTSNNVQLIHLREMMRAAVVRSEPFHVHRPLPAHTHTRSYAHTHTTATGIQVSCQRERARERNRFLALRDLIDKLEVLSFFK